MTEEEFEREQIMQIKQQAAERAVVKLIGRFLIVMLLLCAVMIYVTRGQ